MQVQPPDFMIFTGNANPVLASEIAQHLGTQLGSANVGRFSDGEVTVEISIAADGSVSNVRVVRSQPRGTFDREVLNTVRDWRFEPMDGPATITRTFTFRP